MTAAALVPGTALPDAWGLPARQRAKAAALIKTRQREIEGYDIAWPDLPWFNSAPCAAHAARGEPHPLCRDCGVRLRRHQRIGAAWMYLGLPGLLADAMGLGKTATALAVLAMCRQSGELSYDNRAVIVVAAAAMHDPWAQELRRLVPGLDVVIADSKDPKKRHLAYLGNWEVLVVSERTLAAARGPKKSRAGDVGRILDRPAGILVYDDLDAMRNPETRTFEAVMALAARCTRVMALHATPLDTEMAQLWGALAPVGGEQVLGALPRFRGRYAAQKTLTLKVPDYRRDKTGRTAKTVRRTIDDGVIRNKERIAELRRLIDPLYMRRTRVDDADVPPVQMAPVRLELSRAQRERYDELRDGALRRINEAGEEEITRAEAAQAFLAGWKICSGLAAVDGPHNDDSAKLDRLMRGLRGDLAHEKTVVYVHFKDNVRALHARLARERIGHVLYWGGQPDKKARARALARFREDPACKVLVGTTAIHKSLNLQVSRHAVAVDMLLSPMAMDQFTGRVARMGSPHGVCFFHPFLAAGTQEDGYLDILARRAGMVSAVWGENTTIFASLKPSQLLRLVATGRIS